MVRVLETGDIFFFYQGARHARRPQAPKEVEHSYLVLSPDGEGRLHRLLELARPELPRPDGERGVLAYVVAASQWADAIHDRLDLGVEVRARRRPAPVPAGEGRYALAEHDGAAHLAYELELPGELGPVQEGLGIRRQASYHVEVLNPASPSPLGLHRRPRFPADLQDRFASRLAIPATDPRFLDSPGCELALTGAGEPPPLPGIRIETHEEREATAEIFRKLGMEPGRHPTSALFRGEWRP